jgi:hypothetical protein
MVLAPRALLALLHIDDPNAACFLPDCESSSPLYAGDVPLNQLLGIVALGGPDVYGVV